MKIVIVTGNSGTGKTTWAKKFIIQNKTIFFDINGEYTNYGECFFNTANLLTRLKKVRNKVVIIDEATAFFSNRGYSEELNELLQLRRHNKHFFIFIYHSIYFIPKYLRNYINYLVCFQQNIENEKDLYFCSKKITVPQKPFESLTFKIM
jgi:SpoVK/Ycf46/Vps4 family AAA+-type ATPase